MQLFRFEVTTDVGTFNAVIAATDEETAFALVEIEIEKNFLKIPELIDITMYEKKKINKGTGYILT